MLGSRGPASTIEGSRQVGKQEGDCPNTQQARNNVRCCCHLPERGGLAGEARTNKDRVQSFPYQKKSDSHQISTMSGYGHIASACMMDRLRTLNAMRPITALKTASCFLCKENFGKKESSSYVAGSCTKRNENNVMSPEITCESVEDIASHCKPLEKTRKILPKFEEFSE